MMDESLVLCAERVSKKFCRQTRPGMYYGLCDVGRSMMGMTSTSDHLRRHEFWALEEVSFSLRRGERLGLLGRNGSGKSTLLRVLAGIYQPDAGQIEIRGTVSALIALGAGFHPLLTGRDNIYLNGALVGMRKREIDERFDQIVEFAEIGESLDAPVKTYSSGMHVRLGFAIAIHATPDVLLIDEVLAVGDSAFQDKCIERVLALNRQGTAIIFVSHSTHVMERLCEKGLLLKQGKPIFLGDIRDCIGRYFEDLGCDNLARGVVPTVVGLGKVEIAEVKVYQDSQNRDDATVEFGKDFHVEFAYRFRGPSRHDNEVRVTIRTFAGREVQKCIIRESTIEEGRRYSNRKQLTLDQSGVVRIKVLNPRLFPQSFVVDVAVVPADRNVHLGGLANAALFHVVPPADGEHYFEYGNMTITEFDFDVTHAASETTVEIPHGAKRG